ncbi:MAG: PIN domain-containing protein [Acidobacteriota bacterium]|nr:PIN domain-containing protein [Acidobacteriota bacterium]
MPERKVIDSWALLAWLLNQSAAAKVEVFLQEADAANLQLRMSWINAGEVYYISAKRLGPHLAEEFLKRLPSLPVRMVVPTESDIISAARLKGSRRLSYADAFAAALAIREGCSLITGDPELAGLNDLLPIDWIG